MEKAEQVQEWAEAQKITVSTDLVEAAKTHLQFLAAVELRNCYLYEDDTLQRAVYRYNAFWLPLLSKHLENPVTEESLVVPLDCELIWHCHRLNPIRYIIDCKKLYGRILTNHNVISSIHATSKSASATEEIWTKMYPEEPYELDLLQPCSGDVLKNRSENDKFSSYDLIAAVKRQMSFTYQACRPNMLDELFLQEALCRYKGFLHMIRRNRKAGLELFCVPTYDIDLMWHTHQLYPDSYCKDMKELVGFVVQHDDSDSDKSKGSKLDTGYHETSKQWQQMFGSSYLKAGAMSKGKKPTPVTNVPYKSNVEGNNLDSSEIYGSPIQFPTVDAVEVILEFADVKNLPQEKKEKLLVGFSKKNPVDKVFNTKSWLGISSASEDKLFAAFQCEPKGEFLFELVSYTHTSDELKASKSVKTLGSCSLSFGELVASGSQRSISKWVSVDLASGLENPEPVLLHVLMSFSPPMPSPQTFQLVHYPTTENDQILAYVLDFCGRIVLSLQKRNIVKDETKCTADLLTEVYCIKDSGKKHSLVEFDGNNWSFKGTNGSFKLQNSPAKDDSLLQLLGYGMVKLFPGRRLEFEPQNLNDKMSEKDFKTVVEFSTDYPYGRAIALINSKTGTIKTVDEATILSSIALAFILFDIPKGDQLCDFSTIIGEVMAENESGGALRCYVKTVGDTWNAADCACGPCKDAAPMMNVASGGDTWNAAVNGMRCLCPLEQSSWDPRHTEAAFGQRCYVKTVGDTEENAPRHTEAVFRQRCHVKTVGDTWNAADCACGPCKDAAPMKNVASGGDTWNAALGHIRCCPTEASEPCKDAAPMNDVASGGDTWNAAVCRSRCCPTVEV